MASLLANSVVEDFVLAHRDELVLQYRQGTAPERLAEAVFEIILAAVSPPNLAPTPQRAHLASRRGEIVKAAEHSIRHFVEESARTAPYLRHPLGKPDEGTPASSNLDEGARSAFDRIAEANRVRVAEMQLLSEQARRESRWSFNLVLGLSALGALVVLTGVGLLFAGLIERGAVTAAAGVITQFLSAIPFAKDREARQRLSTLEGEVRGAMRMQSAVDLAETIGDEDARNAIKREVIARLLTSEKASPSGYAVGSRAARGPRAARHLNRT